MRESRTIQILNTLLRAENASLVSRLGESDPFVTLASSGQRALVDQILAEEREHEAALIERILALRGSLAPRYIPTNMGGVHYLDLSYLMPAVIASKSELVEAYRAASGADDEVTNRLIARHLANHERHLAELQKLRASFSTLTA